MDHPVKRHILAGLAALAGAAGAAMATTVVQMMASPIATPGTIVGAPVLLLFLSPIFFLIVSAIAIPVLVVLGLPAHALLRAMKWDSVWAYAVAGLVIGLVLLHFRGERGNQFNVFYIPVSIAAATTFRLALGPSPLREAVR